VARDLESLEIPLWEVEESRLEEALALLLICLDLGKEEIQTLWVALAETKLVPIVIYSEEVAI
jgi:hypothetical protein